MLKFLRKLFTIIILLIYPLAIGIGLLFWHANYTAKGATIRFTNRSGQTADRVAVKMSGRSCIAERIENGGTFSCRIERLSEGGFAVEVALRNGKAFTANGGYVTGGMDFFEDISIGENGELRVVQGSDTTSRKN